MIVYATEFPSASGVDVESFLSLAKRWLTGSPKHPWQEVDLQGDDDAGLRIVEMHGQVVQLGVVDFEGEKFGALEHEWIEREERKWVTELVARRVADGLWISVRLFCHLLLPGKRIPQPKKPYIIKQLLGEFGGGPDGGLTVSDKPRYLGEDDEAVAIAVIKGDFGNRLPVVYVSVDYGGQPYIDPLDLAQKLSGSAHVLVEPGRSFSFRIMDGVKGLNAYGGAVGIYWPGGVARMVRLLPRMYMPDEMCSAAVEHVRDALCSVQPSPLSTWADVRELVSRKRIGELREVGSKAVDDWVAAFSDEIAVKEEQLRQARQEVQRLRAEIQQLEVEAGPAGAALLTEGDEHELFPGEIREILVSGLKRALASAEADSRANHVLLDLVERNISSSRRADFADEVKSVLSNRSRIGDREISWLRGFGFTVTDEGKHYKAVYRGDGRYTFSISKTPSDYRSGKNLASTINRKLFK